MECYITYVLDKLWPMFLAVFVTQWITQKFIEMRRPKLEMVTEGILPCSWKLFKDGRIVSESPYHVWRIKVQQVKILRYISWLIKSRESALQCNADLTFYTSKGEALFTMQGRWANTPEISFISSTNQQEKIIYPDRISISYHSSEPLDCVVKFDGDKPAYCWNNESYATNGRNARHKLEIGIYRVSVRLSGQNIQEVTTEFNFVNAGDWNGTSLTLAKC